MGSLVAELAEKLSSATNNFDIDSGTIYVNTSADTVGIGTTTPGSKLDVQGTMQVGVDDTGHDVKFFGATAGAYLEWDESADELEIRGGAATPGKLLLSTAETTVVDGNKLGQIDFQAPLDSAGTDAILVGASIHAEADATFSSSVNSTDLVFSTGDSEAATEKMRITSDGNIAVTGNVSATGNIQVDDIVEKTSAHGVEIDGVTLKDGDVSFGDGKKAQFGASNDLQIYHTGAYSAIVDDGAGNLVVAANDLQMTNADVSENYIRAYNGDRVELYHNNGEKLRTTSTGINVSGNVGIGTTAPAQEMHIKVGNGGQVSSVTGLEGAVIRLEHDQDWESGYGGSGGDFLGGLEFASGDTSTGTGVRAAIKTTVDTYYNTNSLTFYTAPSAATGVVERVRIDSTGKVGIGTTAPNATLDVAHSGHSNSGAIRIGDPSTLGNNTSIYMRTSGVAAIGAAGGDIVFDTNLGSAERMRIDHSSGNVGIGTTSFTSTASNRRILELNGSSTVLFNISVGGTRQGYLYHDTSNMYLYNVQNNNFIFGTNNAERMHIDSNGRIITLTNPLIIGSTSVNSSYASGGSAISNALLLERSTSPPDSSQVSSAGNNTQAYLYSKQSAGTAGVFVMDSNGNETQISTHTRDDEKDYEIFDSSIINGKKRHRRINVIKLTRALEKLTGEKFLREWYD